MSKGLLSEGVLLRSATIPHSSPMGLWPVDFVDLAAMVCGVDETKAAALLAAPKIPQLSPRSCSSFSPSSASSCSLAPMLPTVDLTRLIAALRHRAGRSHRATSWAISPAAHKDVSPGTLRPPVTRTRHATELSLTSNTVSRAPNAACAVLALC